ncbi:LLM class flavin-dependent oxidoreductase [Methylococcus mesophilus]|uniref:LLM class flavin-dependent oxidoreductase n=1 Tax=Methylococcus mesophilus TaxID=2993564 RepID=UPI00224B53DB|nr:LLM class flavin-dependent oxidoreductase [Methylococcus mesophilus]UZR29589.1 LLM class flavin-dependent oxidoreductase [Methylococcus mesophilus]
MTDRKLRLGAFIPGAGQHVAAWRHPDAQADGGLNLEHYKRIVQTAERGKFDAMFLADGLAANFGGNLSEGRSDKGATFEPVTLFSALSVVTTNIGFIATASTTYEEPYQLARKFASLDYLSNGRAGWNVVTSAGDATAKNFNRDQQLEHAQRYERANEFVDTVKELWDSWEDDAIVKDKESGVFFDPAKVHAPNHKGKHFQVAGPLNVARPPQGYPVIVQAGQSEPGKELAARTAEVIFTAQQTLEDAQTFYKDVKSRLAKYGRTPDQLKIMPGVSPYVGRTEAEARAKYEQLQELIHPDAGLALLSGLSGGEIDLSQYPLDGPLPELPATKGIVSRQGMMIDIARKHGFTIRQLYQWVAGARGHWTLVGSAEQIADHLQEWFEKGAADGFNVLPPYLPGALDDFVDLVIPELQRRGLFRAEYEGRTLRENLGLARPQNQFGVRAKAA